MKSPCSGASAISVRHAPALLLSMLLISASGPMFAAADITEVAAFWSQGVAEGNLSALHADLSQVRLWLEGQGRFNDVNPMNNMNWYQGVARAALGYAASDRLTFWVGYTFVPTQNYDGPYIGEQHVWPAVRYVLPTTIGTFTFREMVESRFVRGDAPGIRSRTLARLLHPIASEPRLGLVVWDEAFFNLNNVENNPLGGLSGFNQNRAFAGLSWTFNANVRAELGYMNLLLNQSSPLSPVARYTSMNTVLGSIFIGW
jgi:hypothetical protein